MNLHTNDLMLQELRNTKHMHTIDLAVGEYPYYDTDNVDELILRPEYVQLCLESAQKIWNKCDFSNNLTVLFEDRYNSCIKGEKEFVKKCLNAMNYRSYIFKWYEDDELFEAIRHIWDTDKIDTESLFKKIIISDIGDCTGLDCAVYIIDNNTKNVFFLYDDRGVDIYSDDEEFIYEMKNHSF